MILVTLRKRETIIGIHVFASLWDWTNRYPTGFTPQNKFPRSPFIHRDSPASVRHQHTEMTAPPGSIPQRPHGFPPAA